MSEQPVMKLPPDHVVDPAESPGALVPQGADPMVMATGIEKYFALNHVLRGCSMTVWPRETIAILGRSGSGKSVTLRQLIGLEPCDGGSIEFEGRELTGLDERALAPIRRRVAMLFQGSALFDSMSVFDNLAFPFREHRGAAESELPERVRGLLAKVGLGGIEDRYPADLSGGMKKRVALARALALEPDALLFDEPTTGLDPMTSASIARLIADTRRDTGSTVVVVTHDVVLARRVADRIAFLDRGRFRFVGTFDEADRSADPLLLAFLTGREEDADVA
jgi:phospholipid/cholesterol/gamma-HCH transport system ATP-binding protein